MTTYYFPDGTPVPSQEEQDALTDAWYAERETLEAAKADALAVLLDPTTGTTIAALRATVERQRIAYLTLLGEEPV